MVIRTRSVIICDLCKFESEDVEGDGWKVFGKMECDEFRQEFDVCPTCAEKIRSIGGKDGSAKEHQ